jgi:cell wall-associated NlpC family hydrolase
MTRIRGDRGEIRLVLAAAAALLLLPVLLLAAATGYLGQHAAACTQPLPAPLASASIPARYLALYRQAGQDYSIPWEILAGIGEVESGHGRSRAPGVRSGQNAAGAAGPMQFGIGGAAGNTWGGAPVHPATQHTGGYGIDGDHDGITDVYDPGDAIPSAAYYLKAHGAPGNLPAAIFAYNHSSQYVTGVLGWAARYAARGAQAIAAASSPQCEQAAPGPPPPGTAGKVIGYAEAQLGKPYQWGATGPDAFDCSGLAMMAYRAAGITIPRTSQQQWAFGPRVPASQARPGDLVFFAGSDGTRFSGGPGCKIRINPSVCPAQMPESSPSVNAAGVVDAGLSRWQKCVAARVILYAASQLGKPYEWGATGPDSFDCSGLAMMAYRAAGIGIPRTSEEQWAAGPFVPPGQEEPGDLVFFAGSDGTAQEPGHVGIVLGGGLMIDAPHTGADVRVDEIAGTVGFTRPAAAG